MEIFKFNIKKKLHEEHEDRKIEPQREKWKPRDVHRLSLIKINLSGKHPVFIQ
ncbi:MAG: hypothetical protein PWP46_1159 [Fusobacteriaceae bacterium]|jgi:hypothetical protein|nr:hypothetical protein [Fusobacteriaceae bacterium]